MWWLVARPRRVITRRMKTKIRDIFENAVVALLWSMCWLFSILPACIRYGVFSPFVSFIMRRVARYRYDVIMRQLRDSFPEKSDEEIAEICRRYYDHLAEMVIGTLSLAGMNDKRRRASTEFNLTDNFHEVIEGMPSITSWKLSVRLNSVLARRRLSFIPANESVPITISAR